MRRDDVSAVLEEVLAGRHLLTHPFYRRWEAGELSRAELADYAGQYRHFEAALPEVLEHVVAALGDDPAGDLVAANLADERGVPAPHVELFDEFMAAVGGRSGQPGPAMARLVGHYRHTADTDPVAALGVLASYEIQASAVATSKAEGLRRHYGVDGDGTRFWDVHGAMEDTHGTWTLDALALCANGAESFREAAQAGAQGWWAFLDERQELAGTSP